MLEYTGEETLQARPVYLRIPRATARTLHKFQERNSS